MAAALLSMFLIPGVVTPVFAAQLTVSVSPSSRSTSPGGTVQFTLTITQNYAGADIISMYALSHSTPISSWWTSPDPLYTNGQGTYYMTLYITVSSSASPGTYYNIAYVDSWYHGYNAQSNTFYIQVS